MDIDKIGINGASDNFEEAAQQQEIETQLGRLAFAAGMGGNCSLEDFESADDIEARFRLAL